MEMEMEVLKALGDPSPQRMPLQKAQVMRLSRCRRAVPDQPTAVQHPSSLGI